MAAQSSLGTTPIGAGQLIVGPAEAGPAAVDEGPEHPLASASTSDAKTRRRCSTPRSYPISAPAWTPSAPARIVGPHSGLNWDPAPKGLRDRRGLAKTTRERG